MTAGSISEIIFKVRCGNNGGVGNNFHFNGNNSGRKFSGVLASSITITEIKV